MASELELRKVRLDQPVEWLPDSGNHIDVGIVKGTREKFDIKVDPLAIRIALDKIGVPSDKRFTIIFSTSETPVLGKEIPDSSMGRATYRLKKYITRNIVNGALGYKDSGAEKFGLVVINLDKTFSRVQSKQTKLQEALVKAILNGQTHEDYLEKNHSTRRLAMLGWGDYIVQSEGGRMASALVVGHELGHVVHDEDFSLFNNIKKFVKNGSIASMIGISSSFAFLVGSIGHINKVNEIVHNFPAEARTVASMIWLTTIFLGIFNTNISGTIVDAMHNTKVERNADLLLGDLKQNGALNDFISAFDIKERSKYRNNEL
jgi:hypothetical protein